jgi:hypothetical protein
MSKFILAAFLFGCAPVEIKPGTSYRYKHVGRPGYGIAYVRENKPDSPPAPPQPSVREQYKLASELFVAGRFDDAEVLLLKIYERDKNPITLLNVARCRERQGRYDDAAYELVIYFGHALASAQSADGAESLRLARVLLKQLSKEKGNREASGRVLAAGGIDLIEHGDYSGLHQIDVAFRLSYDFSLLYWQALGTFRMYQASFCEAPKCTYQHFNTFTLDNLRTTMNAYFLGTADETDIAAARVLMDEVDAEYRREAERERLSSQVAGGR